MPNNTLRLGGMNSGLDTEALVEAMTARTKLKITKQNRKSITLKWKQEAYQDVTGKLTDFQNKYFDILNSKTSLKTKSAYNKYSASVYSMKDGVTNEGTPLGVTVKSSANATPGTYDVKVTKTATQASYKGSAIDSNAMDLSSYTDSDKTYAFTVMAGDKAVGVSFKGGDDAEAIRKSINEQLADAFGTSNSTAATGRGLVYMDDNGKLVSSDRTALTVGGVTDMGEGAKLNLEGLKEGSNKLTVQVGAKAFSLNFQSYTEDYLKSADGKSAKASLEALHFDAEAEKAYNAAKEAGTINSDALKAAAKTKYLEKAKTPEERIKLEQEFDEKYNELDAYKDQKLNKDDYKLSDKELAEWGTRNSIEKAIAKFDLGEGNKLTLGEDGSLTTTNDDLIAVTADPASANTLGASVATSRASQITTETTLRDLGIEGDSTITINGKSFTFTNDYSIKKMMSEVNASSAAGAQMTYSTLTNSFSISSSGYGTAAKIEFSAEDGSNGSQLLSTLGLTTGTFTAGTNLELEVNGEKIESSSNSFTVDGTTMTFGSAAAGAEFHIEVKKDNSELKEAIKSFVEDYNKLIEDVYKQLDEKPEKDYYALTDDDIEEMDLSEKQQEKWETMAKKGLLHNDSAVSKVMQDLRSVLTNGVKAADGQVFSLVSMGIKTTSDWAKHGVLELDEKALDDAIENYSSQIEELFTGTTVNEKGETVRTGIMYKLDDVLTGAVKTTGARKDKGSLIQLAGAKTGTSVNDNSIYDQLKSIQSLITNLESKYEKQQDRYWKQFSSLESMMGDLNSQTASIQQLMQF